MTAKCVVFVPSRPATCGVALQPVAGGISSLALAEACSRLMEARTCSAYFAPVSISTGTQAKSVGQIAGAVGEGAAHAFGDEVDGGRVVRLGVGGQQRVEDVEHLERPRRRSWAAAR
jgi:hypothetical protein